MSNIRIGVYVCWCGTNIAKMVDVKQVAEAVGNMDDVVISKDYKYMCSDPGQELIIKDIKEHKLNRVVVSACSPRIHELTFRKALENAGLNAYLFQMANIREQVSWVHVNRKEATKKAIALVRGAINRVRWHEPLEKRRVDVNPATLIIGGGIAGMSAALEIARADKQVILLEKEKELGGQLRFVNRTFPDFIPTSDFLEPMKDDVLHHPRISVLTEANLNELHGYIGNFIGHIQTGAKELKVEFGNIIVASGLKPFNPAPMENYGYGKLPNVITSLELEKMLQTGEIRQTNRKLPEKVAIIHCVGSRSSQYHEFCSSTCCMTALKYSNQVLDMLPNSQVYQLYADMRAMGKGCEELYTATSRKNVMFLMYDQEDGLPYIRKAGPKEDCNLLIEVNEKLSGERIEVPADLVVLMVGMEAHEQAKKLGQTVGISLCGNEFYIEKHPKLDPVATTTDGVYVSGSCQSPKNISDSITQAKAAAARILATINYGSVEVEVTTAHVNEDICCGCQTCVRVCPYGAISYIADDRVSRVNEVLCKGCGTCTTSCPTGAISSRHFTEKQILSQIEGVMLELMEN
ncbi:MAG: CoB--CoM heterodisulfide reductase iron-sulfur subunit A family protein [Bacteroidetes bacterium]|nr:CoB--CoM heterodisulfide reductase iron-sulfur subunit A family protein [Bacteroidota bacterium]